MPSKILVTTIVTEYGWIQFWLELKIFKFKYIVSDLLWDNLESKCEGLVLAKTLKGIKIKGFINRIKRGQWELI